MWQRSRPFASALVVVGALAQLSAKPAPKVKAAPSEPPKREAPASVPVEELSPEEEAAAFLDEPTSAPVRDPLGEGTAEDIAFLVSRQLLFPVEGIDPAKLKDSFYFGRSGGRSHRASDIMAPKHSKIVAVADGVISTLDYNKKGGITIYQHDAAGPYTYYYAHLERYAPGLKEGQEVKRGDLLGFVGTTGNARGRLPHLHFAIYRIDDPKRWWSGVAINPFPLLTGKGLPGGAPQGLPASLPASEQARPAPANEAKTSSQE